MTGQIQRWRTFTMMNKAPKYKHNLPFSETTRKTLESQQKRIKKNKASLIIVDGGVGEGKTTLAVHLADFLNGSPISFSKQLGLGGEEFQEKLRICFDLKLPVVVYDEAGDFNSRGALTQFNRSINRIFDTYRAFKIIVIIVLPNFGVLDQPIFDKKIPRILFHCNTRLKQGNYSVYSLKRMMYIKYKMKKIVVPYEAYKFTSPNHRGHFLDLDPKRSKELDELSTKGKLNIVTENILKNQGLMTYQDISRTLRKSVDWVRRAISKKKIKHKQLFKRKKYFESSTIDMIANQD